MIAEDCGDRRVLRRDAQVNRQRILVAARELFAVRGIEATLNDVARYAGVGVGTVYRRFATKDELFEAIFEEAIDKVVELAKAALRYENSWDGFAWFVEHLCEMTATDRGLREMVCSRNYGGSRIECARERVDPHLSRVVERARTDGYLRPDVGSTDMPILNLLAGAVSEYAGHIEPDLWRRYVALLLDGLRAREQQDCLPVDALTDEQLDEAKQGWHPAG